MNQYDTIANNMKYIEMLRIYCMDNNLNLHDMYEIFQQGIQEERARQLKELNVPTLAVIVSTDFEKYAMLMERRMQEGLRKVMK